LKARTIQLLFLLFSISFILLVLYLRAKPIHIERLEAQRIANIQKVCMKAYPRARERKIPQRSFIDAEEEVARILTNHPLSFKLGDVSLEENLSLKPNQNKVTLKHIVEVLNHVDEDIILIIETHTDRDGSNKQNLKLSQERADLLKSYIRERSHITLIVAIGYGEEIPLSNATKKSNNRRVEIHLKRIHP
jgi:outer membrane protein OmpA-like peptidoglycan-associated protein